MKTIVVTGASRGLGREIANLFASSGWQVIGTGRSERPTELDIKVNYYQFDLADPNACTAFWQELKSKKIEDLTLVNNAGGFAGSDLAQTPHEDYELMMTTNYFTALNMTQALVKTMSSARMFNIISAAALAPSPHASAYGASKAAARQFFQSLQKELSDKDFKITNLYPNFIATADPAGKGIKPRDLAQFIFEQANQPASFYVKDVTLIASESEAK